MLIKRREKAIEILLNQNINNLKFLGDGHEGVVFTDKVFVYKVMLPINSEVLSFSKAYRRISFFTNLPITKHLYQIEIIKTSETFILKYLYEKGEICKNYTENEAISILTELWQLKIIILDCKPKNCIRVNNNIKIIDLDGSEYTDNLFLNMCTRMFIYIHYLDKKDYSNFQKLKRSAINNFDLPELIGLREFVNRVYANIIFEESKSFIANNIINKNLNTATQELIEYSNKINLENIFFNKIKENKYLTEVKIDGFFINKNLYFEPKHLILKYKKLTPIKEKVSLLIKTCPQDINTIEENIKHIVKQLSSPNPFFEIIISIDSKETNFLREYNNKGSLENLIKIIKKLKIKNIIDNYYIFENTATESINQKWFNLSTPFSHTSKNAPVTPQLFAFEKCKGDYILQVDSDVIIGRKKHSHSFLKDMLFELKKNKRVLSVGFNIYNKESNNYFGFENGGFVPEVRMGLIYKKRIINILPLPNNIDKNGKLELTWHRSLHKKQKEFDKISIRGGNHNTFYIHPQNYRKKKPYAWMSILDSVEQNKLPNLQYGKFDVEGSLYDWSIGKRNEKLVIVSVFRNVELDRFLRMWSSLITQTNKEFGIILFDDSSNNGLPYFIDSLIKPYKDRVTLIKNRNQSNRMENVYRSIHYYMSNPESIVVMLDGDDALIGKDTLKKLLLKYDSFQADVVIGRFHQTYRIQPHYRYPVDFTNPRLNGGNVWQHLKTFKKYLFDSIPLTYFKHEKSKGKLYENNWFETCDDFAFMVPIIEMSKQPIQMNEVSYFYERNYVNHNDDRNLKELCIADILNKTPLNSKNIFKGRKTFQPNMNMIEIDITYKCNLKCIGCNRSCTQAPTSENINIKDILEFINESILLKKKWKLINILGGEPTLHPDFEYIIKTIHTEYIEKYAPNTILQIVSNGVDEKSRLLCEKVKRFKNVRIDYGSYKITNVIEYFSPFNDAPIDDVNFNNAEYKKACWVTSYCGIGLNKRGYYACSVCGGIDRVMDKNQAISKLSDISIEKLSNQLNIFCKYCGNFKAYNSNSGDFIPRVEKEPFKNIITKSWKEVYKKHNSIN